MHKNCPFCQDKLVNNNSNNSLSSRYEDRGCTKHVNHCFIHRVQDDNVVKVKIGLLDSDDKFFWMIIDYLDNSIKVWKTDVDYSNKINIPQTMVIDDFTHEKLLNKMKMMLTFA